MDITLCKRTQEHVEIFWRKVQDEEIQRLFPVTIRSLEEALALFAESVGEDADSFGKVIYFDGEYVGDVWCYAIDNHEKVAMLSIVIFAKEHWRKGIATKAARIFIEEVFAKFNLNKIGAFTFANNHGSSALLRKVGFSEIESFEENGIESQYFELANPQLGET